MDYTGVFTYNEWNLIHSSENVVFAVILAIAFLIILVVLRYIFLFIVGIFLLWESEQKIKNRKKVLADLVLMKDIQSELEKEIEQATLKAAFQS